MRIIVVGAGVSGLTTGLCLRKCGFEVIVVSRQRPERTTSATAGAVWLPHRQQRDAHVARWARRSYHVFQELAMRPGIPVTMVKLLWLLDRDSELPWWIQELPAGCAPFVARNVPAGHTSGLWLRVPCIQAEAYLGWLLEEFSRAGGKLVVVDMPSLSAAKADLVVNCSGLGARHLMGDRQVQPVRGQLVYVSCDRPLEFMMDETRPGEVTYIFPRRDRIVLGGTSEPNSTVSEPSQAVTADVLSRAAALQPALLGASVTGTAVGLRPYRPEVRLDTSRLPDGRLVVHNYGHAGHGFSLSWGCADTVVMHVHRAVA